jgi:hypothetical protein
VFLSCEEIDKLLREVPPHVEPIVKLELGMSQRQPRSFAEA